MYLLPCVPSTLCTLYLVYLVPCVHVTLCTMLFVPYYLSPSTILHLGPCTLGPIELYLVRLDQTPPPSYLELYPNQTERYSKLEKNGSFMKWPWNAKRKWRKYISFFFFGSCRKKLNANNLTAGIIAESVISRLFRKLWQTDRPTDRGAHRGTITVWIK